MELLIWGDQGWGDELFTASLMTIAISLSSYAVGLVFGCIGAALKLVENRWANILGEIYTTVFRGIPELLVVYLFFFGGSLAVMSVASVFGYNGYIEVDAFIVGMLAIGVVAGAYAAESLRGGYLAIPKGLIEAGLACGMTRSHLARRVIFPQTLQYALPGLSNLWLISLKSTALLSVTGLVELTRQANIAAGSTYKFLYFYIVAALIYAALSFFSKIAIKRIETWSNRGTVRIKV
jgi:octopine/nopaline transport system permease protein